MRHSEIRRHRGWKTFPVATDLAPAFRQVKINISISQMTSLRSRGVNQRAPGRGHDGASQKPPEVSHAPGTLWNSQWPGLIKCLLK